MKPSVPFKKHHFEFLSDPERARAYLEVALDEYARDHDRSALLLALKDVASAQGGLGRLARQANLNRAHVGREKPVVRRLRTVGINSTEGGRWKRIP